MKISIFLVVFCASLVVRQSNGLQIELPKEFIELLENLNRICQAETGIADSVVEEISKGKLSEETNAKCYLKCIIRELQVMKDDGELDMDLVEATMPDELKKHGGLETVKKCNHIKESDMCETAYKLMVCFQKENPELAAMFE